MLLFEPPPHLSVLLSGREAARHGRRAVEELVAVGLGSNDLRAEAALAVSELVTNAIRAAGECSLSAWFLAEHGALRVEITDTSSAMPQIQRRNIGQIGGHGLRIVDEVSTRWGVIEHHSTKTVWFEITAEQ